MLFQKSTVGFLISYNYYKIFFTVGFNVNFCVCFGQWSARFYLRVQAALYEGICRIPVGYCHIKIAVAAGDILIESFGLFEILEINNDLILIKSITAIDLFSGK